MPLYEYSCDKCGDRFEVMQKFSDAPLATHEKCGGPVHRLISAPALQFKGTGWYITDYAKGSGSAPSDNGSAAKSDMKSSETSTTKSDTPASTSGSSTDAKSTSTETK